MMMMMNPNPNPNKRKKADNVEEKSGMKKKKSYESKTCNLKKKTFELSTLCGVDVAFISFAPDGSLLHTWPPNKNQLLPIAQRYQQNTPPNDDKKKYIKSSGSSSHHLKPPNQKAAAHQSKNIVDQPPHVFGKSSCDFVNPPKPKTTTGRSSSSEDDDEVAYLKYCFGTIESKLKELEEFYNNGDDEIEWDWEEEFLNLYSSLVCFEHHNINEGWEWNKFKFFLY